VLIDTAEGKKEFLVDTFEVYTVQVIPLPHFDIGWEDKRRSFGLGTAVDKYVDLSRENIVNQQVDG
jgi:hypothetical protein